MAATKTNGLNQYFKKIRKLAKDRGITFQQAKDAYVAEKNGTHQTNGLLPVPPVQSESPLEARIRTARDFIGACDGGVHEAIELLRFIEAVK